MRRRAERTRRTTVNVVYRSRGRSSPTISSNTNTVLSVFFVPPTLAANFIQSILYLTRFSIFPVFVVNVMKDFPKTATNPIEFIRFSQNPISFLFLNIYDNNAKSLTILPVAYIYT